MIIGVVAWQLAAYLPGIVGDMLADMGEVSSPVYMIFVQGVKAIGNGPVMQS